MQFFLTPEGRFPLYLVELPFGLRLLLPFWCRRGGIGWYWCAEKEHRGQGGSGQGKIGAKAVREWVLADLWIQLGSSCDTVGQQFCIFWHFWPIRIQSGSCPEAPKNVPKPCKNLQTCCFFKMNLGASGHWCPTGSRLDPDWIPIRFTQKTLPAPISKI